MSRIIQEGIDKKIFLIDNLERDVEVFLHAIAYFFPIATTEKYFEPQEDKLSMLIDWFIEKWCIE